MMCNVSVTWPSWVPNDEFVSHYESIEFAMDSLFGPKWWIHMCNVSVTWLSLVPNDELFSHHPLGPAIALGTCHPRKKGKKKKERNKERKKKESMTRLRHTCMQDTTLLHLWHLYVTNEWRYSWITTYIWHISNDIYMWHIVTTYICDIHSLFIHHKGAIRSYFFFFFSIEFFFPRSSYFFLG